MFIVLGQETLWSFTSLCCSECLKWLHSARVTAALDSRNIADVSASLPSRRHSYASRQHGSTSHKCDLHLGRQCQSPYWRLLPLPRVGTSGLTSENYDRLPFPFNHVILRTYYWVLPTNSDWRQLAIILSMWMSLRCRLHQPLSHSTLYWIGDWRSTNMQLLSPSPATTTLEQSDMSVISWPNQRLKLWHAV